jgi:hypothetical protein
VLWRSTTLVCYITWLAAAMISLELTFPFSLPALYTPGIVEFYFETARTVMDLTLSRVLVQYKNIRYIIAHVGGAFPAIQDRFLKQRLEFEVDAKLAYNTRYEI